MTHPSSVVRCALAVLLLTPCSGAVAAQARPAPAPFETLDLALTVLADVNHGALHRWWSPGPAIAAGVTMPFYAGDVELGVQYASPTALRDDVPAFRSLFAFAGWSGGHGLGSGFTAGGGVRVGVMGMRFRHDTVPQAGRESELGVAARAALRWMPGGVWFTEAGLSYQSILTHRRMEQVFLSVALGRRFGTPVWLRDFLD
jgi:hypothetical protein